MVMHKEDITSSSNVAATFIPKTISEFLAEVSMISNVSDKLLKFDHFISRLDDELRKIDAFKRELPLSVLIVNDAIVALKDELVRCRNTNVQPVFQEFLPSKESNDDGKRDDGTRMEDESGNKKNWMSSVKLWNNTGDQTSQDADHSSTRTPISMAEIGKRTEQELDANMEDRHDQSYQGRPDARAFLPSKGYSAFPVAATGKKLKVENKGKFPVAELSLVTPETGKSRLELGSCFLNSKSSTSVPAVSSSSPYVQSDIWTSSQTSKKQRRYWSPELHTRFVRALEQLGGSQVATPKKIRELMQVDGLTNAEVNSRLQKYRLHSRRFSTRQLVESALTLSSGSEDDEDGEDAD